LAKKLDLNLLDLFKQWLKAKGVTIDEDSFAFALWWGRVQLGLTQTDLAEKIKTKPRKGEKPKSLGPGEVSKYQGREHQPRPKRIKEIEKIMGNLVPTEPVDKLPKPVDKPPEPVDELPKPKEGDSAMFAEHKTMSGPGGIDFNAMNLNLQIKRDGRGVPLPLALQDMAQLNRIQGFEPEIIEIKPAVNLPILNELQQKLQSVLAVSGRL
jgi:hypothetical protein